MQQQNRFAFKEWSIVCEAERRETMPDPEKRGDSRRPRRIPGRASRVLAVSNSIPSAAGAVGALARPLLESLKSNNLTPGTIAIRNYVDVEQVIEIQDESLLARLAGLHVWSESTLAERFQYRTPMLFALLVRVYRLPDVIELPESPHFAGCRSWVDFPIEVETSQVQPVLTDKEHREQLNRIRDSLA